MQEVVVYSNGLLDFPAGKCQILAKKVSLEISVLLWHDKSSMYFWKWGRIC